MSLKIMGCASTHIKLNLNLVGEQPAYFPGQMVRGILEVISTRQKAVDLIFVELLGKSEVILDAGKYERTFRDHFLSENINLFPIIGTTSKILPCGHSQFSFELKLRSGIPETWKSFNMGFVSYEVRATVVASSRFSKEERVAVPIFVVGVLDVSMCRELSFPQNQDPISVRDKRGSIYAEILLPKGSGYVREEWVPFVFEIRNESNSNVGRTRVQLVQSITLGDPGCYINNKKIILTGVCGPQVGKNGGNVRWNEDRLRIPNQVPLTNLGSRPRLRDIAIEYCLIATVEQSREVEPLEIRLPIVVGSTK